MKRLLAKSILLAGGMTVSSQLLALGLGEMNLDSALNQPLRADIELIDTAGLSAAEMKPKLASAIDFERAGVERYQFLTQMKFSVNGDRIVVTTRDPINEPFLNFLVELNWPSGRVLREYTVLLDPPVFEEGRVQPLVAVPAGAITSTASVSTQPQATSVPAQKPAAANKWSQPAAPGEYKVQPDDTLWQIALETRPNRSISPQQMMVALQDVNPDAFINGNINRLKTHTTLIVPDESIIQTISGQEAVVEVQRQNRELTTASAAQIDATGRSTDTTGPRKTSGGGEVRLLSAKADGQSNQAGGSVSGSTGNTSSAEDDLSIALENLDKSQRENQELVDRLTALEEQLAKMERLITLQNDQLASMSAGVAADKSAADAVVETPTQADPVAAETAEVSTPDVAVVADAEEQVQAFTEDATAAESAESETAESEATEGETAVNAESTETDYNYAEGESAPSAEEAARLAKKTEQEAAVLAMQKRAAEEARKAEAAAKSPLDTIIDTVVKTPIEYIAVGLGLLLSVIAGLLMLRKRKKDEEEAFDEVMADDSIASDLENAGDVNNFDLPEGTEEQSAFGADLDNVDDTLVEHGDLGELPVSDDLDDLDLDGYDDNDADQYETVGQTEDAISESDIYIAYGKFDQALELLNSAIDAEPERIDLRLKHLEILASLDNNEDFAQAEGSLNALGNEDANRQAEDLRAQLSNPIEPVASSTHESALSLDGEIPSLDESAESEFDDGMDFGEALDFGDDVVPEDDGIGASLEEVPELELGETSDFDANAEGVDMSLEDDALKVDDNLLAFDLDDDEDDLDKIDAIDTDLVTTSTDNKEESDEPDLAAFNFDSEDETSKSDETALDLDGELEELSFESPQDEVADTDSLDLSVASETVETELEELAESTDDKLDFEAEPALGANDALDDLLDTDDIDLELADGELQIDLPENDLDGAADAELTSLSLDDDDSDDELELGDLAETASPDLQLDSSASLDLDNLEVEPENDISALDLDVDLDVENTAIDLSDLEETSAELEEALPSVDLDDVSSIAALTDVKDAVDSSSEQVDAADEVESFESVVAGVAEEAIEEPLMAAGADEDSFADLEDLMSTDAESLAENSDLIGGIDLDELAAADDEFDFLAGTDECATKLDLARAYVDMEDSDGARELLQEVIQEGNDEQKNEAKDMMDKLS